MEIIRQNEATEIKVSESCSTTEYLTHSPNINIARIIISGRFPEKGVMWNTEVEEIIYVEKGSGHVCIEGAESAVKQGDVVLYKKNEKVFWEGELILITTCTPPWTSKQHAIEE